MIYLPVCNQSNSPPPMSNFDTDFTADRRVPDRVASDSELIRVIRASCEHHPPQTHDARPLRASLRCPRALCCNGPSRERIDLIHDCWSRWAERRLASPRECERCVRVLFFLFFRDSYGIPSERNALLRAPSRVLFDYFPTYRLAAGDGKRHRDDARDPASRGRLCVKRPREMNKYSVHRRCAR